ncbi:MAG: formate/nitrite transporter family protein, partial [Pseudomonadota bacterium]
MPGDSHDAYKPAEIAALIETAGVAKAALPLHRVATLALLAGAFIGFGSAFWCIAMAGAGPGFGPQRVLGGVVFALGLILVVVGGAELFTGNALMVMAAVDRRITLGSLLRNWGIVWLGNLVGAVGLAVAFGMSGLLDGPMGTVAAKAASVKAALPPVEAFVRGALCNALVCLAVWLS